MSVTTQDNGKPFPAEPLITIMLRNKLKQISQLAKIILFFILFSVNIYLSCIYLRSIPESEYISGMFLGIFILQLFVSFLFIITDLWLHNNAIRMIAVIILATTSLFSFGYIYCTNSKPIASDIFILMQGCAFIYLLLAIVISHLIKKSVINKES